jgi:WD40 repeat protein
MAKFSFDVFLSHNSNDQARVRQLAERLRGAGVRVWFDEWIIRPGDDIYLSIERGLESARALVLCLSPAALASDWVGLERSTVLFRDPRNANRRFIPLLLANCDLPDTIRRYKYVDFREEAEAAFEELLFACLGSRSAGKPPKTLNRVKPAKRPKQEGLPAVLERTIKGHPNWVRSIAVSPDGKWLVSCSDDKTIRIWDIETGNCHAAMDGHDYDVNCVAITADGKCLLSSSDAEF